MCLEMLKNVEMRGGCSLWGHGFWKIVWVDNLFTALALTENIFPAIPRHEYIFIFKSSACYSRATRCVGDIVTLLWFRAFVHGPCEHDRDYTVACFFVKLGRHINHGEKMNPIDFGGQRSKVKVTMGVYENKLGTQ